MWCKLNIRFAFTLAMQIWCVIAWNVVPFSSVCERDNRRICLSVLSMTVVMKWHAILSIVWIYVLFSILKNSPANTLEKLYTYASHDDANKSTHWNTQHSIQVIHCLFCERDFFPTFNETQSIHKLFISSNELWNYSVDGASQKGNGELNESACAHGKWTDDREFIKGPLSFFN